MTNSDNDIRNLLSYIDDDLNTLIEIGLLILSEFPEIMNNLEEQLAANDSYNSKQCLHRLRGSLKILHMVTPIEIIQSMEDLISKNEFKQATEEYHILYTHIQKIKHDIGKMISEHSKDGALDAQKKKLP